MFYSMHNNNSINFNYDIKRAMFQGIKKNYSKNHSSIEHRMKDDQGNSNFAHNNHKKKFQPLQFLLTLYTKSSKSNSVKKDWCSPDIVQSCKRQCKLYKIFIHNTSNKFMNNYEIFTNRIYQTIVIAKGTYFKVLSKCGIKKHTRA